MESLDWETFIKVEMHVGEIKKVYQLEGIKKPSYQLEIDFGPLGTRKSSAQITQRYSISELLGKKIVAVTNFPPKQIGNMLSQCLVLGAVNGLDVAVLQTEQDVPNGTRIA